MGFIKKNEKWCLGLGVEPQDAHTLGSLFCSLLQALQRPSQSPAFLLPPQRFAETPWAPGLLDQQTAESLSWGHAEEPGCLWSFGQK